VQDDAAAGDGGPTGLALAVAVKPNSSISAEIGIEEIVLVELLTMPIRASSDPS